MRKLPNGLHWTELREEIKQNGGPSDADERLVVDLMDQKDDLHASISSANEECLKLVERIDQTFDAWLSAQT